MRLGAYHSDVIAEPSRASLEESLRRSSVLSGVDEAGRRAFERYVDVLSFPAGTRVVSEGGAERDMYLVLDGEASVLHAGLEIARAGPGDTFGELGLVTHAPRTASVDARTDLAVARLTAEQFGALSEAEPRLALAVVRAVVGGLRLRLTDMTERVNVLLRERSLPRRLSVRVRVGGQTQVVRTGSLPRDVLPVVVDGRPVVAALLDRRPVSLGSPVTSDCTLEPLTTAHWEGARMFEQSLSLLLLEAAHDLDPALSLRVGASLGFGRRVEVECDPARLEALVVPLAERMRELVRQDRELRDEWWTVEEASAHFLAAGWNDATELLRFWRDATVRLQSFGSVYAIHAGPLVPSAGSLSGFQVLADEQGLLLVFGRGAARRERTTIWPGDASAASEVRAASRHAEVMTQEHERWLEALGITSAGEFNRVCVDGEVTGLVRVAEGFHEKRISSIADAIRDRAKDVKVVCVAGPSSSGKTTFIKRLRVQLQVDGIRPLGLSLDDYYCDRADTPRDERGDYDYEAFEALRSDLLQSDLARLLAGERVRTARYDFVEGRSLPAGADEVTLGPGEILLVEGIHGLNPALLRTVPDAQIFRIFICPLAQLSFDRASRVHASDVRLVRRIVRDRHRRGANAADNILRWPSVRRGERRHIFPYQYTADAVFDSSLIYELSVLRVFAERYLFEVPRDHEAYPTAHRLLELVRRFVTIYPDHVPPTSILREFIGGSGFEY